MLPEQIYVQYNKNNFIYLITDFFWLYKNLILVVFTELIMIIMD